METKIRQIAKLTHDLLNIIYPNTCAACQCSLTQQEHILCLKCEYELPQTNYHLQPNNPIVKKIGGVIIKHAAACYSFGKGAEIQQLIHHLKYSNWGEIGVFLGKFYGNKLKNTPFAQADLIIPVPLHPHKLAQRGYNQSQMFAQGLSEMLNINVNTTALVRKENSESQTQKSRIMRWLNTKTVFAITNPDILINKHILLVDDVITTGATLQSCAQAMSNIPGISISILSIAATEY